MIHRFFFAYALYPLLEKLMGRDISSKVRVLEQHVALPFQDRKAVSARKLCAILEHAGEHVPYYRELFASLDFDPQKVKKDPDYVQRLPFLTRDIVRREGTRLLSARKDDAPLHTRKTGGSTGPSAIIHYSQEALDWTAAVHQLVVGWTGKRRYCKEAHLSTRFPKKDPLKSRLKEIMKCCALNRVNVLTDALDDPDLEQLWQRIMKERPYLMQGHPSTLYALARHVAAHGYTNGKAFEVFESTGEALDARRRSCIESSLNCRIVNRYGSTEFGVVAYERQTSDRDCLDVLDFMVWPEDTATEEGPRELVFTGLTNMAMPLIRYRTGDLAELHEHERGWYLSKLMGRVHDMVTIHNRAYPSHYIQDLLDKINGIVEFQVMERDGAIPVLKVVLETDAAPEQIARAIREYWGDHVELAFVPLAALVRRGWRAKFARVVREAPSPDATDGER